jgi:hypothetical protein
MKRNLFFLFFLGLQIAFSAKDNNVSIGSNKTDSNCNSCNQSLIEMRIYAADLEKRIKSLMDELARWMKLYESSVVEKASSSERHAKDLIDLNTKFCNLVHRLEK